jgi:hypothetical protein
MSGFPIFGTHGQEGDLSDSTGEHSPSGTTFLSAVPTPLPRIHDGSEQRRADEFFMAVLKATNPRLAAAAEIAEQKAAAVRRWEGNAIQLQFAVNAATDRVKTTPPDQLGLIEERRAKARTLEAAHTEACEELEAAREELTAAAADVQAIREQTKGAA